MHCDDTTASVANRLPRRLEHGGNLDRMVTIVVDDGDTLYFANFGKAAVYATEIGQCRADLICLHAQMTGHGHSRQGV